LFLLVFFRSSVSESPPLTVRFGVCLILKSLCHDSKEITKPTVFVQPVTLCAQSTARRRKDKQKMSRATASVSDITNFHSLQTRFPIRPKVVSIRNRR